MDIDINQIAEYYANAPISFVDIFREESVPGSICLDKQTSPFGAGLVFPIYGEACFTIQDKDYIVGRGKVIHAGPGMKLHKEIIGDQPGRFGIVHYHIGDDEVSKYPFYHKHFEIKSLGSNRLYELIQQLEINYTVPGSMATIRSKITFMSLIEEFIISAKMFNATDKHTQIEHAVEYIHNSYQENISISEVANDCGFDGRRFAYLFQKHIGMSPIQYLTELRIRKAKELLRQKSHSISEVAYQVGYKDAFYFSRLFKKQTGMSPSSYLLELGKSPC